MSLGTKLQDVLVLTHVRSGTGDASISSQSSVRIPLANPSGPFDSVTALEKIVVLAKTVGQREDFKMGSVSIPQELFLSCGESRYKQWITLFDS